MTDAHKNLCHILRRVLADAYRVAVLNHTVPLMFCCVVNNNHFQVALVDVGDAIAAFDAGFPVQLFLMDSLKYEIAHKDAIKLYVLATIFFFKKGTSWMRDTLKQSNGQILTSVIDVIPDTFLKDLKEFKVSVENINLEQKNGYDCGIFCVLQMSRLFSFLYGNNDHNVYSFKTGDKLCRSHILDCLTTPINKIFPITQKVVNKWRVCEFLYLLKLWMTKFKKIKCQGLNDVAGTTYAKVTEVPYIGVIHAGKTCTIASVNYHHCQIQVKKKDGTITQPIEWSQVKFALTPTVDDIPFQIALLDENEYTYYPSTKDICRLYPGHALDKHKFISSDYLFWKIMIIDKRTQKCGDPNAMAGLGMDSFNVENASAFLKSCNSRKRKHLSAVEAKVESLISDDSD